MTDKETAAAEIPDINQTHAVVQDTVSQLLEAANVTKVYGRPIKQGDVAIIPAAEVLSLMGFGVGAGGGTSTGENAGTGAGGGGGGGGRVLSRPVAIIIATPDEVRVEPVVDPTKIALAAITAGGFMFGMMLRMMNKRFK